MKLTDEQIEALARRSVYDQGPIPNIDYDRITPTQDDYVRLGKRIVELNIERAREMESTPRHDHH